MYTEIVRARYLQLTDDNLIARQCTMVAKPPVREGEKTVESMDRRESRAGYAMERQAE